MATLTLPTDTVLLDPDTYTFLTNLKTNVDALYATAPVVLDDDTTYAVLAANTGKLHVVPDLTADCTITLPAAAAGLRYEFWYGGAAADTADWIIVPTAGFYIGGVVHQDLDGDTDAPVYSDGNSNDVFTVLVPEAGTRVTFVSDGTNWYVTGNVASATVPTMADS
jgi:hypothetical protein